MIPDIPLRQNEEVIRSAEHVTIKNGRYHLVLTNLRIIVISEATGRPADIDLSDIRSAGAGRNPAGAPAVLLDAFSSNREIRTMILGFVQAGRGPRDHERDQWITDIAHLRHRRSDQPVPQQSPQPFFCSRCGRQAPPGASFCDRCGTPLVQPGSPPAPERRPDEQARASVQRPARKHPPAPMTATRKYADLPLISPEVRAAKVAPGPRRAPEKRIRTGRFSRGKIAAGAGIAAIVLVIALIIAIPGVLPDFSQVLNLSGNASTSNTSSTLARSSAAPASASAPVSAAAAATPAVKETEAVSLSVSSTDPPETSFDQYIYYYQTGDPSGLYSLLSGNVRSSMTEVQIAEIIMEELKQGTAFGGYTVTNADVSDNSAVLVLDTTWEIGGKITSRTETVPFVREDGQWKLNRFISASQI